MPTCVVLAEVSGQTFLALDPATTDCAYGVLLTWQEYQSVILSPMNFEALGITSSALATDYAFGFSAVGLGFVLSFPIAMALKTLKLL